MWDYNVVSFPSRPRVPKLKHPEFSLLKLEMLAHDIYTKNIINNVSFASVPLARAVLMTRRYESDRGIFSLPPIWSQLSICSS